MLNATIGVKRRYISIGDPARTMLTNILSNAVKFTEEGSVLVVVSLGFGDIEVAVQDTGIYARLSRQAILTSRKQISA